MVTNVSIDFYQTLDSKIYPWITLDFLKDDVVNTIFPFPIQGGIYIFQLMDFYSASGMSILWVCFFQTIAISWIFGAKKFCDCIHQMMGIRLNKFWYICWVVFAPVIMAVSITHPWNLYIEKEFVVRFLIIFLNSSMPIASCNKTKSSMRMVTIIMHLCSHPCDPILAFRLVELLHLKVSFST